MVFVTIEAMVGTDNFNNSKTFAPNLSIGSSPMFYCKWMLRSKQLLKISRLKSFWQMLLHFTIVKLELNCKSQFHVNIFFFHRPKGDFLWGIFQFQTISDTSQLFADTRLRGKIKFKRLQTKLTIAEKFRNRKNHGYRTQHWTSHELLSHVEINLSSNSRI